MTQNKYTEWLDLRNLLIFQSEDGTLVKNCDSMLKRLRDEYESAGDARKNDIAEILGELAVDLQSYIIYWHLQAAGAAVKATNVEIDAAVNAIYEALKALGRDDLAAKAKVDADKVQNSNLFKVSRKTDASELNNRIGNDAYYGLTNSMRRGCALVTTNPVMVNAACRDLPEKYRPIRDKIRSENPDVSPERLVMLMTTEIVYEVCYELYPVFKATGGEYGYVSLQVNPHNANDGDAMFEEVDYIYDEIKRRFGGTPNLVFKIPATQAALSTVSRMTKKGIGVNITASCSVSQHIATAKIIEEGDAQVSFITMMSGRLDDRIAEELESIGVKNGSEIAKLASGLVIERSYDILYRKLGYKRSRLLAAAIRGPWNVEAALANGPSCIYISLFPPKSEEYDAVMRKNLSVMGKKPDEATMKTLLRSKIFCEAYNPEDLQSENFYKFFPVNVTLESFCEKYDDTVKFMTEGA
jgi:transaldolase